MSHKIEPNAPAFPTDETGKDEHTLRYYGLTKREYFAGLAMQGILANQPLGVNLAPQHLAKMAVMQADALIKELNNQRQ